MFQSMLVMLGKQSTEASKSSEVKCCKRQEDALHVATMDIGVCAEKLTSKMGELRRMLSESRMYGTYYEIKALWLCSELATEEAMVMAVRLSRKIELVLRAWLLQAARDTTLESNKMQSSCGLQTRASVSEKLTLKIEELLATVEDLMVAMGAGYSEHLRQQFLDLSGLSPSDFCLSDGLPSLVQREGSDSSSYDGSDDQSEGGSQDNFPSPKEMPALESPMGMEKTDRRDVLIDATEGTLTELQKMFVAVLALDCQEGRASFSWHM